MDPNATLRLMREALESARQSGNRHEKAAFLAEAAAHAENLDEWLSRGGALPREWDGPRL